MASGDGNKKFYDMLFTVDVRSRLEDDDFARDVYRALCNMRWRNRDNPELVYACSWRYAGGLVAQLRCKNEDYMDFYCSGKEGQVSVEVQLLFGKYGWEPYPYDEEKYE